MQYRINVEEVVGGTKIEVEDMTAFAAQPHQIPQRIKDLFEVLYPKPDKKGGVK